MSKSIALGLSALSIATAWVLYNWDLRSDPLNHQDGILKLQETQNDFKRTVLWLLPNDTSFSITQWGLTERYDNLSTSTAEHICSLKALTLNAIELDPSSQYTAEDRIIAIKDNANWWVYKYVIPNFQENHNIQMENEYKQCEEKFSESNNHLASE